jgi:hypothetical protein
VSTVQRARLCALAVLSAVAAAGCGVSDEERVESTVEHFYRAAAQGDGRGACGQLSPAARSAPGAAQCEVSIEQLGEIGGPEAKRRIASVDVIDTKVDGDTATTRAQIPGQTPGTLQLRRISGEWKLESLGSQFGA